MKAVTLKAPIMIATDIFFQRKQADDSHEMSRLFFSGKKKLECCLLQILLGALKFVLAFCRLAPALIHTKIFIRLAESLAYRKNKVFAGHTQQTKMQEQTLFSCSLFQDN